MAEIKFSFHQQPKSRGYLECFVADPGHKLVQSDLSAIEPMILTEFSQDPTLMKLYGPHAKPNDVYLFNAAHLEMFKDEVRKYYDPDNPTPESIALAKKMCKKIRANNKLIHLASGYGCSWKKLRSMLITMGFPVTADEARSIHRDYWRLYGGIKHFEMQLTEIWRDNGGYIPDILGMPTPIAESYVHDITNRFCQKSGHLVLQKYLYHTERLRRERKIPMRPWLPDFHDEFIFCCPTEYTDEAAAAVVEALAITNEELGMTIQIKADVMICDNLAQIKCEE